jgi:hypothetical protein
MFQLGENTHRDTNIYGIHIGMYGTASLQDGPQSFSPGVYTLCGSFLQ